MHGQNHIKPKVFQPFRKYNFMEPENVLLCLE